MKPDTLLGKLANCLVSFVAGMTLVTLFFWQHLLVDLDSSLEFREFAWAIVVILPGMFCASIIVHELGHLLVALAVEMRIFLFRIGPVAIVREGQRFRLRIRGRSTILGYVLAVPRHVRNLNRRLILFVAAGPLTNLLVGSALFLIYFLWNEPPSELSHAGIMNPRQVPLMPQTLTSGWVVMAAILNLSVSAHNLIPGKIGGLTTDGGQLANLLRGGEIDMRLMNLVTLITLSQNGVRARDWDRSIIEGMLEFRDGSSIDVSAAIYAYYHARDCGLIDLAGCLVDQAVIDLELHPAEYQSAVLLEAIYYDAFYRGDARMAREALPLAEGGLAEKQTRLRAEAAVSFAEGHYEEAITLAKEGLDLIPHSIDPGGAISEADWLRGIVLECQQRMSRTEPPNLATHAEGTVSTRTDESR